MTTPTGHTLRLTVGDKRITARVVYLQPKAARPSAHSATVHIVTREWIEPDWYRATYHAGDKAYSGKFLPLRYKMVGDDYHFEGVFESEHSELPTE